jgi:hypothetical protein
VIYIAATPRGRSSLQCNHAVTLLMQQVLRLWLWLFHSQLALTRPNGPIGGILSSTSSASFHFQCQDLGSMHQTCFQMVPLPCPIIILRRRRSFLTVHLCDAQVLLLCARAHVVAGRHPQRRTCVVCVCVLYASMFAFCATPSCVFALCPLRLRVICFCGHVLHRSQASSTR